MTVIKMRSGMRVAATWSGLKLSRITGQGRGAVNDRRLNADQTSGRSKCMSGRQFARTRHASAKATIPGDM